jgi:hypothetical protein
MTVPKLLALATIYREPPERLLDVFRVAQTDAAPGETLQPRGEIFDDHARRLVSEGFHSMPIPEQTTLLPGEGIAVVTSNRRVMVGRGDLLLFPLVRPGSILRVDTTKRAIVRRKDWANEYDRPIYLAFTRQGYFCSWCEVDTSGQWLTLVAHSLSGQKSKRLRYRREVEIIGRAISVTIRLP